MFALNKAEKDELVANCDRFNTLKHSTVMPNAFTEQGVAMLSSVLKSQTAVDINIKIMRAFVAMRKFLLNNQTLYHIGASLKDLGKRCFAFDVFDSSFIADIMARL